MMEIRPLQENDFLVMEKAFAELGWSKPASLFQGYFQEQMQQSRWVWVAFSENKFAGFVTLKINSNYMPFAKENIPEIKDLNVLPIYRKQGIGSALMQTAEDKARHYGECVGIGVGLYADYGNAQKMYVRRGYMPDGNGVTYNYKPVKWDVDYKVDDDLVLWFTKKMTKALLF